VQQSSITTNTLFYGDINQLEKRLWESADQLRANSHLSASEYSVPVLGLIFLRYADHKFTVAQKTLEGQAQGRRRRGIGKADFQARGVMYLPEEARFSNLLNLPEGENIGMRVNNAMRAVEAENEELEILNAEARELEERIAENVAKLLG